MFEIETVDDLERVRERLILNLRCLYLDEILLGIRNADAKIRLFVRAGLAQFAIRYAEPRLSGDTRSISWEQLEPSARLAASYLVADPIAFDKTIQNEFYSSNPVFAVLRMVGGQFPYEVNIFAKHAQPYFLYGVMPNRVRILQNVPKFDFPSSFEKLTGVTLQEFVDVGFIAWTAAKACKGFTLGYFDKARFQGMRLPSNLRIQAVLNRIMADRSKFISLYERRKQNDRRFGPYDYNPLFEYPLISPWPADSRHGSELRMCAPLPDLIIHRMSPGIFYEMFNEYGPAFSEYFGYLMQEYVGEILRRSAPPVAVIAEQDIRTTYPEDRGTVPDWIVFEGSKAILIECKATRFSRAALATGSEDAVDDSLKQLFKGLRQCIKFRNACQARQVGLERFSEITEFTVVVVSLEPLLLINSMFFRQYVNEILAEQGLAEENWIVASLQNLEVLQPHFVAGIGISDTFRRLQNETYASVLEDITTRTGLTYRDSFLMEQDGELYQRLGIDRQW